MLLVFGPRGSIDFSRYTRWMFVWNYTDLVKKRYVSPAAYHGKKDFGAGDEDAFKCPSCSRVLPFAIVEADHIVPRAKLKYKLDLSAWHSVSFIQRSGQYTFRSEGAIDGIIYDKGEMRIKTIFFSTNRDRPEIKFKTSRTGSWGPIHRVQNVIENDIENLQLLCGFCNRSKGGR